MAGDLHLHRACMRDARMTRRPDRKALAAAAVLVVIMALRQPTGTRSTGRSRFVRHKAAARLKGCRASLFYTAKADPIPDPTALNGHASRRSTWR
jgi:hypothetical protein